MEALAVVVIGWALGSAELLSRYRDAPYAALQTLGAWAYVLANVVASLVALALIHGLRPEFAFANSVGPGEPFDSKWWTRVLIAGLGAMAFFRSSLFTVRIGNTDVAGGPAFLFQVLLSVADRDVDRARAQSRAQAVAEIMRDIDFGKAKAALPAFSFAVMQNVSADEQKQFHQQNDALIQAPIDHEIKGLALGLALMNLVGEDVLRVSVASLRRRIIRTEVADIVRGLSYHKAKTALPPACFAIARTTDEKAKELNQKIAQLDAAEITNAVRLVALGHALVEIVGVYVLETAIAMHAEALLEIPSPAKLEAVAGKGA